MQAAKRGGKLAEAEVRAGLDALEALMPGIVNLSRMRARDWLAVLADVNMAAEKLICLKGHYPGANVHMLITSRPKMLLQSVSSLSDDATKVMSTPQRPRVPLIGTMIN